MARGDARGDPPAGGTPEEIRQQVQRYVDAGVTHRIMAMGAPFGLDAPQLFADEVMAAFRLDPLSA